MLMMLISFFYFYFDKMLKLMTKSQMCRGGVLNKCQSTLRSRVIQYRQLFLETM
jgi:hypothetical protein